jgi:hypothetical protein
MRKMAPFAEWGGVGVEKVARVESSLCQYLLYRYREMRGERRLFVHHESCRFVEDVLNLGGRQVARLAFDDKAATPLALENGQGTQVSGLPRPAPNHSGAPGGVCGCVRDTHKAKTGMGALCSRFWGPRSLKIRFLIRPRLM